MCGYIASNERLYKYDRRLLMNGKYGSMDMEGGSIPHLKIPFTSRG
jgi:hypothetical protein